MEAEDGWTVVHHKKGTSRVVLKGRKKRVTKDFYRFQVRSQREDRTCSGRRRAGAVVGLQCVGGRVNSNGRNDGAEEAVRERQAAHRPDEGE